MPDSETLKPGGTRARPLSLDARRAMILEAVMPLLAEHGRDISSKQIAQAAGIAEGTVFRAFGDKESLIEAGIVKLLDPEPLREELRAIDPKLPLEQKVLAVVMLMRRRFGEVFRIMAMVGGGPPPRRDQRHEFAVIIARLLQPEAEELNWPPERVAHIIRLITFASSLPALNENTEFTETELASIVLYGVAGQGRVSASTTAIGTTESRH
ncbi:MAG TPA: helix-turn-helix domain-containing protein [Lacisediminihabitans sp.]|nr:helix-turn-helix domain-containing protein [Lacisediminihabitans sp.]HXD61584.1 helix-turn-helix domain-containing protein [Lacisediminihabitans sp.]